LEKFNGDANVFGLKVVNLPQQITHEFADPESPARLYQIKFTESVTSMDLPLKLYLPQNVDEQVVRDSPLEFYCLALDEERSKALDKLLSSGRSLSASDIDGLRARNVKLELVSRGVRNIEVLALSLFHEIKVGESVNMEV
jgi:hypothetical protein